jgi:hypothetical protein
MAADADGFNDMNNDIVFHVAADMEANLDDKNDVRDDVEFLGPLD